MKESLRLPPDSDGRAWLHRWAGRLHPRHHHDELELNLVASGTGRYLLDDRVYDLGPDCLVWLFPRQEHILIDQSRDFSAWMQVISPRALRRAAARAPYRPLLALDPPGHFCRRLAEDDARRMRSLFADLEQAGSDLARRNPGIAYATLTAWAAYERAPQALTGVRLHPAVERAAGLIAADVDADLGAVAARAGLSHSRLSRLFHQQTGQTLAAWRNRQRLERFFAIARDRRRTILASALAAGFGSYAQFHRIFKRLTGVGPAQWSRDPTVREQD